MYWDLKKKMSGHPVVPIARTSNYGLKLLKVLGPKIWNSLPPLLRINDSLNNFKKKLKYILINNYK